MKKKKTESAILLIHCPDRTGLVAAVADFLRNARGSILHLDQHVDRQKQVFFMRLEWDLETFEIPRAEIGARFQADVAETFAMTWRLHFSDERPRVAIFVSKFAHCLYDLLARYESGEWQVEVPLIVSNHPDLEPVARKFGVDYRHFPVSRENRREQERFQRELLSERRIDLVILARYMQVLSAEFVSDYPERIINIHHSFLPAFPGSRPYHSASERGVKIIGATSHYVTSDLDEGPIIEQDIVRIRPKDSVADLVRKGRDLEKLVLSRAVYHHLERRVLAYDNRTVVFN